MAAVVVPRTGRPALLAPAAALLLVTVCMRESSANSFASIVGHRSSLSSGPVGASSNNDIGGGGGGDNGDSYDEYANSRIQISRHGAPVQQRECVTSFYRRVRDRRKAVFGDFGRQLDRENVSAGSGGHSASPSSDGEDHSLDHYFDHQLSSLRSGRGCRATGRSDGMLHAVGHETGAVVEAGGRPREEVARVDALSARHVRGGGSATAAQQHRHLHTVSAGRGDGSAAGRGTGEPSRYHTRLRPEGGSGISSSSSSRHRHDHGRSRSRGLFDDDFDVYGDFGQMHEEQRGDDYPDHHLGLLRVPCSIAINSEECSRDDPPSSQYPHVVNSSGGGDPSRAKTPMAAYVDTGAQVTIISASAAKRAGIYHLMDRRYAGRATGVGHCKVLGRIPARHVYFILGEDSRDDFDDDEDDDYYCDDYRGGGAGRVEDEDRHRHQGGGGGNDVVQMDGPALTVLEGTVTQGVDILFGLDVLQDWEAEIRMGHPKSITVTKRRNRGLGGGRGSVVIPFASRRRLDDRRRGSQRPHHHHMREVDTRGHQRHRPTSPTSRRSSREQRSNHRKPHQTLSAPNENDIDNAFSPTASDIESDLDLLDQTGHEFPEDPIGRRNAMSMEEVDDDLLGAGNSGQIREVGRYDYEEDDDDDDDEDAMFDNENDGAEINLSGL